MTTNGHHPGAQDREPLRADEWLTARQADQPGNRGPRSPFARGRGTNGNAPATQPPPPPAPTSEDHDPTSLPIFAGAWTSEDQLPGRTRSDFTLRPLVASPDDQPHAIASQTHAPDSRRNVARSAAWRSLKFAGRYFVDGTSCASRGPAFPPVDRRSSVQLARGHLDVAHVAEHAEFFRGT